MAAEDTHELRAEVGKYLSLVDFPADTEQIVGMAYANGAGQAVLDRLEPLPGGHTFETAGDVWQAIGLESTQRV